MTEFKVTILYGSETGTAQDVAEQIWKNAKRKGLKSIVMSMDDYDIRDLIFERLVIFVVATTGQGEPPSNMKQFWKFLLRRNIPQTALLNLRYGVLGLGDSSYQKFNFAAKKLNKRLSQLGGKELLPIGLADDQHDLGIDAVLDSWLQDLWEKIVNVFHVAIENISADSTEIIRRYKVSVVESDSLNSSESHPPDFDIYLHDTEVRNDLKIGKLIENKRTTTDDHFQDVRLLKFHAEDISYEPGDVMYVRPKNSREIVDKFFEVLISNGVQIHPDIAVEVSETEIKVPHVLKRRLKLYQVAEQYWDLSFKPRKSTMQTLSFLSQNELEREKLQEFASPAGQEELFSYVNRPRRNIVEVLADFPHTTNKLTVDLLFEIMSPIKPRAFSIASSNKKNKDEIHILVAVVKYKTKLIEPRLGLCSNWLANLRVDENIIFWIQRGTFQFSYAKPMILIGPGTGVAPFRSLLLEKSIQDQNLENCILFFGCRNKEKDFHCREEFENLCKENQLKMFCAFSRDQEHKVYVQHVIHEHRKLCWNFLQNNASIYLAGNAKNMPDNVREEFISLCKDFGNLTNEEAVEFIKQLEKDNRYQTETWA